MSSPRNANIIHTGLQSMCNHSDEGDTITQINSSMVLPEGNMIVQRDHKKVAQRKIKAPIQTHRTTPNKYFQATILSSDSRGGSPNRQQVQSSKLGILTNREELEYTRVHIHSPLNSLNQFNVSQSNVLSPRSMRVMSARREPQTSVSSQVHLNF